MRAALLACLVLLIQSAWAQESDNPRQVKGIVYTNFDASQGQDVSGEKRLDPLPGAHVFWKGTDQGTSTNAQGFFRLNTSEGKDTLAVSFIGYGTSYMVYAGQKQLEIVLTAGEQLEAAEISAERDATSISLLNPLNAQTLGRKELAKAACCNLSESFETNASVDAAFTDAVTGTRQIRMLGLDGKYTQIMTDNMPSVRGLAVIYGLNYIPGPWIDQIYISKGAGSVTAGYESITGQINVGMKNPENAEAYHLNVYGNQGGRMEINALTNQKVSDRWGTTLLVHSELNDTRMDRNNDEFLDNPLMKDIIVRNEWKYTGTKGVRGEYQVTGLAQESTAGQLNFDPDQAGDDLWGASRNTQQVEASAKTGYVFPLMNWKSIGSQFSGVWHKQDATFGLREYSGEQQTFRGNVLFSSIIGTTDHKFVTGVSYVHDAYKEQLDSAEYVRTEKVPGAFFEYTWTQLERFSLVAGMRIDNNSAYGLFWTPRLHFRYSVNENNSIKLGAGKGYRTANIIMENVGQLASSRRWIIESQDKVPGFGLKPEEAYNFGLNWTSKFRLNYRDASIQLDFYRTQFENQVITDLDQETHAVYFYNLDGQSYSNSAQVEFGWTPARRVELRLAYRWLDVKADYKQGLLDVPLISTHRAFANVGYATKPNAKKAHWKVDVTTNWIGSTRIPFTGTNPEEYQLDERSEDFVQVNGQITRVFNESFDIYLG
jgi:outer membrane receptor for ferrienterochelin and colicins